MYIIVVDYTLDGKQTNTDEGSYPSLSEAKERLVHVANNWAEEIAHEEGYSDVSVTIYKPGETAVFHGSNLPPEGVLGFLTEDSQEIDSIIIK